MTIDHYSPCPCGSGKKLKFCKCVENTHDYEKLLKLIEGGQELAAIDRINQLLAKTPNAAWLLAIKGELTLSMQEFDSFRETADRFLRLKPDNPTALVMKSVATAISQEPIESSARYLLQGLSEARDGLPSITLTAISILISSLEASGKLSLVGYWAEVLESLTRDQGPSDDSPLVNSSLNLLAKAPPKIIDEKGGKDWKERLAEVLALTRSFRFEQAEKKLHAILRDFPNQPGPLSHLLRAQMVQLDQSAAFQTAQKLAAHPDVKENDRAYYMALALEIDPKRELLKPETLVKYCGIESVDLATQTLATLDYVDAMPVQGSDEARNYFAMLVEDEVPAKQIFHVFDRPVSSPEGEETKREIASSVGTVVLFGKQTDKPARALFFGHAIPSSKAAVDALLTALQLGDDAGEVSSALDGTYFDHLLRPRRVVGKLDERVSPEELGDLIVEELISLPIKLLGGACPKDVAKDETQRVNLLGLLGHFEGEQSILVPKRSIDELYTRLGLTRPATGIDKKSESLALNNVLDLVRIDVDELSPMQLQGVMVRSMSLGASRTFYRAAQLVINSEELSDKVELQVAALSGMISLAPSIDEKLECCEKLEAKLNEAKTPVGRVVIQRVSLLSAVGRHDEAKQVFQEGLEKYPNDPFLMSFMQHLMQQQGMGGGMPGGMSGAGMGQGDDLAMKMMQNASRPKPQPQGGDSGLVLPGQENQGSSDGESKLWLPGS